MNYNEYISVFKVKMNDKWGILNSEENIKNIDFLIKRGDNLNKFS